MTHANGGPARNAPRLLAAILGAAAVAAALATSGTASQPAEKTIKLIDDIQHPITFQFLEPPPNPVTGDPTNNSPGDEIISTNPLLNSSHQRIGTKYDVLTFVTGGKLPQHPSVVWERDVFKLKAGAIFIEELNGPHAGYAIVTGGTGAYAGARGTVTQGNVFDVIQLQS